MTVTKPQNATLIDTISEGYAAINRRPWLVLIPILLNFYLWFGPPLSFEPLISNFYQALRSLPRATEQSDIEQIQYDQILAMSKVDMRQIIALLNFIPTLTTYAVGAAPGEDGQGGLPIIQPVPRLLDQHVAAPVVVSSILGALLVGLLINMLALPISAAFLTQLAAAVRRDHAPLTVTARRIGRAMAAILGYIGLIAGALVLIGVPLICFIMSLVLISPGLGTLGFLVLLIIRFWIEIYIGFTREAIVVSGVGPLRALRTSVSIVRRNFWSTLTFLVISFIITAGSGVIWHTLVVSPIGAIVAIVGSAYIGSGLLAARMAFYRERLRRWQATLAPTRTPIG